MTIGRLTGNLGQSFLRLWSATAVSNLSDGIFWVALPLLAVSLTDSPALVAGVATAQRLPWLLFALVAGAVADRFDRRRTMLAVHVGRVVLIGGLALAVATGVVSIAVLYVVAFLLGILETIFDTAAQSVIPNVVPRDRLEPANARLLGAEFTMNQFVGPPVGGLLAAFGLATAFGVAAAGYVGAWVLLAGLIGSFRPVRTGHPTHLHQDIREGVVYLARHRLLRTLAVVVALINLAQGGVWALLVLYAVAPGPMGLSTIGYGLLLTANAVGSVAGTILAGPIERAVGKPNLLVAATLTLALSSATLAATTDPFLIGGVFIVANVFLGAFNVAYQSLRQRIVPDRILGRVVATFRMLGWGALPLGALIGGFVGEAFGVRAVFVASTVATLLLVPARLLVTREGIAAAEAAAGAEAAAVADAAAGELRAGELRAGELRAGALPVAGRSVPDPASGPTVARDANKTRR